MKKKRAYHNSIYWNGAVYIIGGGHHYNVQSSFESSMYAYEEDFFAEHESSGAALIALIDSLDTYMSRPKIHELQGSEDLSEYIPEDIPEYNPEKTKMEIWNIKESPDKFKTTENWPELFGWSSPHLFIVPDSFFPDH